MQFIPMRAVWAALCLMNFAALRAAEAQPRYSLQRWGMEEGLPHNLVLGVAQTGDGFLWIATPAGLARFDGVEFRPVAAPAFADAKSSAVRTIVLEDSDTLLIANARSELLRVRRGEVTPWPLGVAIEPGRLLRNLFLEKSGACWIVFTDGEAWRCANGTVEKFPLPSSPPRIVPTFAESPAGEVYLSRGAGVERYAQGALAVVPGLAAPLAAVGSSHRPGIWVAANGSLARLEAGTLQPAAGPAWAADILPDLLHETPDGSLWIGLANSVLLRWADRQMTTVATFRSRINGLCADGEGNLWVATQGSGLNRLRASPFELIQNPTDAPNEVASSVCEDAAGDIWLASRANLKRWRAGVTEIISPGRDWPQVSAWVCPDYAGHVWFAVARRLYRGEAGSSAPPERIELNPPSNLSSLFATRDGALWLACDQGTLLRRTGEKVEAFGPAEGLTGDRVEALAEDAGGTLWIGTGAGDLLRFRDGRFEAEPLAIAGGSGIRAILAEADGWRWVGTNGAGLLALNGTTSVQIGSAQGMPDAVISQILADDFGFIWFGSRRGLFKVRRQDLIACARGERAAVAPIVYGRDDGLWGASAIGGHQPAAWKTRAGRLWFTTTSGFVTVDPAPQHVTLTPPRVQLDRPVVDGRSLQDGQEVPSAARRFDFHFTAPVFVAPDSVRYRFRLDGYDEEWSEPTSQRFATYLHLPPGQYRFRVAVRGNDGGWSPAVGSLAFRVVPAWWETKPMRFAQWFAGAMALGGLVYYGARIRLKRRLQQLEQSQRIASERARISRDLHDNLGASLTHVGMLAEQLAEDCREGDEQLRARAARLTARVQAVACDLDAVVWVVSPSHDRLPALSAYLCEYALEFFRDTPVRCRVERSADIPDAPISPEVRHHLFLAAKEAMNNALKHAHATEVMLTMCVAQGAFVIGIADNGVGFDVTTPHPTRHGLSNLRSRVAEAGGSLTITSSPAGTTVNLAIPCPSP
jgi:signal transduction histidine kinase/ligand-binding sensor domain-containing protein